MLAQDACINATTMSISIDFGAFGVVSVTTVSCKKEWISKDMVHHPWKEVGLTWCGRPFPTIPSVTIGMVLRRRRLTRLTNWPKTRL